MLGTIQISGSHLSDAQVKDICSSVANHRVPLLTLRKCKTKDKNFKVGENVQTYVCWICAAYLRT